MSYEQFADDAAELLRSLNVERADVMGYSQGGGVALQLALRHPFWRRHPVFVGAAAVLACWLLANGWYWTAAVSVTAATLVGIRRVRRSRAHRHAGLRARADYENGLARFGDPRGIYGRYPPVSPGWFPDPQNRWQWRYFDGTTWAGHTTAR